MGELKAKSQPLIRTKTESEVRPGGIVTRGDEHVGAFIRIEPSSGWAPIKFHDVWKHRELLYFLTWRDIKVRYKQTVLGATWAIIQPLFTALVFSLFFGHLAKVGSDGVPYPIFSYTALVPWTFFAYALTQASNSLLDNPRLLTNVYFPRMVLPLSAILSGLIDFALAFVVLLVMVFAYGFVPTAGTVFLPLFVLLTFVSALGIGLWLSALNAEYRDVRYVVPFLTQLWLFVTPIAYPRSLLNGPWRTLYGLNPMVGVVEGFRWALLGTNSAPGPMVVVSSVVALLILVTGALVFRRMERNFADIV